MQHLASVFRAHQYLDDCDTASHSNEIWCVCVWHCLYSDKCMELKMVYIIRQCEV